MLDQFNDSLIVVTGAKGVGKTWLAYTVAPPSSVDRVYIHDAENSGNRFVQQLAERDLAFGYYLNLDDRWTEALPNNADLLERLSKEELPWANRREKDSMISYYKFVLDDVKRNLEPGKFDVYVHDTVSRFEAGMAAWVESNRRKSGWAKKAYGEMWRKGVYPLYRGFLRALHQRGVKVVVLTTHLRTPWVDNKPVVGSVEPKGKSILYQLSQLHLWLVQEPANADGAPAGLVIKERLGNVGVEADTWQARRCLPRRIPHCTWNDIRGYLENPADLANPDEREVPTSEEQRMMSDMLTDAQMKLMILQTEKELLEDRRQGAPLLSSGEEVDPAAIRAEDEKRTAVQLAEEGLALSKIAQQLGKPLPLVKMWIEEA